jgi:hypothetical protein
MRASRIRASQAALTAILSVLSAPAPGHAYSLTTWSWNEPVTLKLIDGHSIEGLYRGVSGRTSDARTYAERYEKWRLKHGAKAAPALGETRGGATT